MARYINTASPGKQRNQARRTIAEILRHLMSKGALDAEARDMAAAIVYALREIDESIELTTEAWEKRDYFLKADKFRLEWEWARPAATRLEGLLREARWDQLPLELAALAGRFADVKIVKFTRSEEAWRGNYQRLMQEG
ncbi:MAG: hypothetical protein ACOX2L_01310 [Anaerolineae bacterium]|mgnify:CR=1 FL=1|jgi:hypothetical protein|nr:hypothetical protein [Chloroflexota bacterium]